MVRPYKKAGCRDLSGSTSYKLRSYIYDVLRTITFKLRLSNQDRGALLDTMRAYTNAFSISTKWGFENGSWNRVDNHNATYKITRQSIPDLPSSLVQGAENLRLRSSESYQMSDTSRTKAFLGNEIQSESYHRESCAWHCHDSFYKRQNQGHFLCAIALRRLS